MSKHYINPDLWSVYISQLKIFKNDGTCARNIITSFSVILFKRLWCKYHLVEIQLICTWYEMLLSVVNLYAYLIENCFKDDNWFMTIRNTAG